MSNANEAEAAHGSSRIKHRTFFLNEKFQYCVNTSASIL